MQFCIENNLKKILKIKNFQNLIKLKVKSMDKKGENSLKNVLEIIRSAQLP